MTRHLIDTDRTHTLGARLVQFLRVTRQEGPHAATRTLFRRPRSRNPQSGRVEGMLKPQRGGDST